MSASSIRKFHLKQFSLSHHESTMKVGMDATLLGIWAQVKEAENILDIGTGCGILSLLLASKCSAQIDAIELDLASANEAGENFQNSAFYDRMQVTAVDINQFAQAHFKKYDVIISNPPFFINDQRSKDKKKTQARHSDFLSFDQLIVAVRKLMKPDGKCFLVLPYNEGKIFTEKAIENNLHLQQQQLIFPYRGATPNRINMQFGVEEPVKIKTEKFIIREEDGLFSQQYKFFLKDYLIGFTGFVHFGNNPDFSFH